MQLWRWWWLWRDAAGVSEQTKQTLFPKLEIFSDKNCHKQIKEQVGFIEMDIKQISYCFSPFAKYEIFYQVRFFVFLFVSFTMNESLVWSSQIPFDVSPFSRKSWIKGGESWIKANLWLLDTRQPQMVIPQFYKAVQRKKISSQLITMHSSLMAILHFSIVIDFNYHWQ